jgi:hypothetical protein
MVISSLDPNHMVCGLLERVTNPYGDSCNITIAGKTYPVPAGMHHQFSGALGQTVVFGYFGQYRLGVVQ